MNTGNSALLILIFANEEGRPTLIETSFQLSQGSSALRASRSRNRSKDYSAFPWGKGVQAMCYVLLKHVVESNAAGADPVFFSHTLSPIVSLDRLLDKDPGWMASIFGLRVDGKKIISSVFRRTNPGRKRKGDPFGIGINSSVLPPEAIRVCWNSGPETSEVIDASFLKDICHQIEMQWAHDLPAYKPQDVFTSSAVMLKDEAQTVSMPGSSGAVPKRGLPSDPKSADLCVASKATEWIIPGSLKPVAAFLNDDTIALGGRGGSLTLMDYLSRRTLFHTTRDIETEARKNLEPRQVNVNGWIRTIEPKVPIERNETPEAALKRYRNVLQAAYACDRLEVSSDGSLLAYSRGTPSSDDKREIEIWNVFGAQNATLVSTLPSAQSKGLHLLSFGKMRFTTRSNTLVVQTFLPGKFGARICAVHPQTGKVFKTIALPDFSSPPDIPEPMVGGLMQRILAHAKKEQIAVQRIGPRAVRWDIIDFSRGKVLGHREWLPTWSAASGYWCATVLPSVNQVVCVGANDPKNPHAQFLEAWEWEGKRITNLSFPDAKPEIVAADSKDELLCVVSRVPHKKRVNNSAAMRWDRFDYIVRCFSTSTWQQQWQTRLELPGSVMAMRVCSSGEIRLITALEFAPHRYCETRLAFWTIQSGGG